MKDKLTAAIKDQKYLEAHNLQEEIKALKVLIEKRKIIVQNLDELKQIRKQKILSLQEQIESKTNEHQKVIDSF